MKRDKFDSEIIPLFQQGLSLAEIAQRVPLSRTAIRTRLQEIGLYESSKKTSGDDLWIDAALQNLDLSPRNLLILQLRKKGKSLREIGVALGGISKVAVHETLSNLKSKIDPVSHKERQKLIYAKKKEILKRFKSSEKGRAAIAAWNNSPKGRESIRNAQRKYRLSPEVKAKQQEYYRKRKRLFRDGETVLKEVEHEP